MLNEREIKERMVRNIFLNFFGAVVRIESENREDIDHLIYFYKYYRFPEDNCVSPDVSFYLVTEKKDVPFIISLINNDIKNAVYFETKNTTGIKIWEHRDTPIPPFTVHPLKGKFLILHASVIEIRNQLAIIFPAGHYQGKTTIALEMTRRGYKFLTDDLTIINTNTMTVEPFLKPVGIREKTVPHVKGLYDILAKANDIPVILSHVTGKLWMAHMERIYSNSRGSPSQIGAVVFLVQSNYHEIKVVKIDGVQYIQKLWHSLVNSGKTYGSILNSLVYMVQYIPSYVLLFSLSQMGCVGWACDQIEKLLKII